MRDVSKKLDEKEESDSLLQYVGLPYTERKKRKSRNPYKKTIGRKE